MSLDIKQYWNNRYKNKGTSGFGSHDPRWVNYKVGFVNDFIKNNQISTILDLGCGDANISSQFIEYQEYLGTDISDFIIERNQDLYGGNARNFCRYNEIPAKEFDLVISLDVIYHIISLEDYLSYLDLAAKSCSRYFVVFSTNRTEENSPPHVRHREFIPDVEKLGLKLQDVVKSAHEDLKFYVFVKNRDNPIL